MQTSIETVTQARSLAKKHLADHQYEVFATPLETLLNFPWEDLQADSDNLPTNDDYAAWNLELVPISCLGRMALAGALVEKHFPQSEIYAGEVVHDRLTEIMRKQVKELLPADEQLRKEWLDELLMYELPHSAIIVDGDQFDPLSVSYGRQLEHKVIWHEFWENVLAAIYAAASDFEKDINRKLVVLDKAEEICPGYILLKEKRAGLLMARNDPEGVRLLKDIQRVRPTADNLFTLWAWDGFRLDSQYKAALDMEYTPAMAEHLLKKHGGEQAYVLITRGA